VATFPDEKQAVVAILVSVVLNVIVGIPFVRFLRAHHGDG
jgi:hypothetical protein